jgi:ribosome-associated protein
LSDVDSILRKCHAVLSFEFVRSSGPGGQNVNKVATAVQLRFDLEQSTALPQDAKSRLSRLAGRRVTTDGWLIIEARRYRTQDQNRVDALERFDRLVRQALVTPKPRLRTKATAASRERRLRLKKERAEVKKTRRSRAYE